MDIGVLLIHLVVAVVPRIVSPNLGRRLNRDRSARFTSAIQHRHPKVRDKVHPACLRYELTSDGASISS